MKEKKKRNKLLTWISSIIFVLITAVCGAIIFFNFTHTYHSVVGPSMTPTLNTRGNNDGVFVSKIKKYTYGDIIVVNKNFGKEGLEEKFVIKRLIALEGDKIKIDFIEENYRVLLIKSGEQEPVVLEEEYLLGDYSSNSDLFIKFNNTIKEQGYTLDERGYFEIPENQIFYLGDNRSFGCEDCSTYGAMEKGAVIGKVDYIIYEEKNHVGQIISQFFGCGR